MNLGELMKDKTPNPDFKGFVQADDMVLALDFEGDGIKHADSVAAFTVVQVGIKSAEGNLTPKTQSTQYLRTGEVTVKTGTTRGFAISGDRYVGDPFQDKCLSYEIKYGTGQEVIKEFVYFNWLTGEGERGFVSISVEGDLEGEAGSNAQFAANLSATAKPDKYTYEAATSTEPGTP